MNRRSANLREIGLGAGLIVLSLGVMQQALIVPVTFSYDNVGPRTFPYLIAGGLLVSGISIILTERARVAEREAGSAHDWLSIVAISAVLILQMYLIVPLGWVPVATVSFAAVAWAFGSRQILLSLGFGLALAAATFVLFNYGLQLNLPIGTVVEGLLPADEPAAAPAS